MLLRRLLGSSALGTLTLRLGALRLGRLRLRCLVLVVPLTTLTTTGTVVATPGAARTLRARTGGANAGPYAGFAAHPAEQARLGLLQNLYLGVIAVHPQVCERPIGRLVYGLTGGFHPIHGYRSFLLRLAFERLWVFGLIVEGLLSSAFAAGAGSSLSARLTPFFWGFEMPARNIRS